MSQAIPVIEIQANQNQYNYGEEAIKRGYQRLEELKKKRKEVKETIQMGLDSDSDYSEVSETIKEKQKERKQYKTRVMAQPTMQEANQELKDIQEDIKDVKESLNAHIDSFKTATQLSWLDIDGVEVSFVSDYKLKVKGK